jgi:phosphoglycerate kinase
MKFIDQISLTNKTILVRVDFNVSLNQDKTIADDSRITHSLPTIKYLLKNNNKLILIAHFGAPEKRNSADSLKRVAKRLQEYLPHDHITLVEDFLTDKKSFSAQKPGDIILLENIRFYPGEQANDPAFAKQLAALGQIYVNDAFSVSHRKAASIVGLPKLLPSYGGLLLKKEVTALEEILKAPKKPFVALIGGKKISTKIAFINKLATVADYILLGGGLANTFLSALGHQVGGSIVAQDELQNALDILKFAKKEQTTIVLPKDAIVATSLDSSESKVKKIDDVAKQEKILDIGPETQADFGSVIAAAKMIVWNGPVGYMENPVFKRGTDFLYYAITSNPHAISVVGGGDTLSAIADKEGLDKITHISMGGGAMLEYVENGTLPGLEALE